MPPLLCPAPLLLDQSFPRSSAELKEVSRALGVLHQLVQDGNVRLALTESLRHFVELFEWHQPGRGALLLDIHRFLSLLFTSSQDGLVLLAAHDLAGGKPHPHPSDCEAGGLVDYWCEEVGALLTLHLQVCGAEPYCIGVACAGRFSGLAAPTYVPEHQPHAFPLVGPTGLHVLADAFEFEVPSDVDLQAISFEDAYKRASVIGASHIDPPSSGSHYKVHFPGSRPWVIDPNADPIPDRYVGELVDITGLPKRAIKYALKRGKVPPLRLRFTAATT